VRGHAQDGFTPLHKAVWHGQLECARLLLERGADKEAKGKVCASMNEATAALLAVLPPGPAPADDASSMASDALLSGAEAWRCVSLCAVARRMATRR
jgi:ankyrin repeat protein